MGCSIDGYSSRSTCEAAGGTWTNNSTKEYAYYIEGLKIAIVEMDAVFDNDINSKNYGPGVDKNIFKSPLASVNNGIEIVYTYGLTNNIKDESAIITLPDYLCKAIVYYVKGQYMEDSGQFDQAEYFMSKFRKQIEKFNDRVVPGVRMMSSGPNAIR